MKSANFASRKPRARIIASIDDDDDAPMQDASSSLPATTSTAADSDDTSAPLFKRKSSSTKARKAVNRSLLSLDDPHEQGDDTTASLESSRPIVVKKSTLSRQVVERNASQSTSTKPRPSLKPSSSSTASLPSRSLEQLSLSSASRPSYSKEALQELKTSTPTTPINVPRTQYDIVDEDTIMADATPPDPLNVAGKFAAERAVTAATAAQASIPDESTIKALKVRRAMLAQNPDYIALDDTDGSKKKAGSRLAKVGDEDEEILETFVEDGGLALGKKAEREKERRRRDDIREAIEMVERPYDDEDEEDGESGRDSDADGEWEANRIRTGGYGASKRETLEEKLRRPPAVITPLPSFPDALARLKGILAGMVEEQEQKARIVEELQAEREMIEKREKEVQEMLKATTEKYEKLKLEAGGRLHLGRGLESFGEDGAGVPAV